MKNMGFPWSECQEPKGLTNWRQVTVPNSSLRSRACGSLKLQMESQETHGDVYSHRLSY